MVKEMGLMAGQPRAQLVQMAIQLGQKPATARKANYQALERFIQKKFSPPPPPQSFPLGLGRTNLKEAAETMGMSPTAAKRASTKRLEAFIVTRLGGKGLQPITLSERQREDIAESVKHFGISEGLYVLSAKIRKITGAHDSDQFLRLTVGNALRAYTDEEVTSSDITAVIAKLDMSDRDEVVSGLITHEYQYQEIIVKHLEEKEERVGRRVFQ